MAIDPICGMEVDESTDLTAERDGKTYYFCCDHCRQKFLNPEVVQLGGMHAADEGSHKSSSDGEQSKDGEYYCPMCEGVTADQPGACPKCGMALERARPARKKTIYTCPMHPEVRQEGPGSCPKCGMALEPAEPSAEEEERDPELVDMTRRFWGSLIFTIPVFVLAMGPMIGLPLQNWLGATAYAWLQLALATPVVFWAGWPLLDRGVRSFLRRSLNMFSLIAVGVAAAYLYSAVAVLAPGWFPESFRHHGQVELYFESAAVVVTLVLLGQMLELRARQRSGSAIRELLALAPPTARRITDDGEEEIPLEHVHRGDRLRVRPGDKIPIDGSVVEGSSNVDEAMITGESTPIAKGPGDEVIGGSVNGSGSFVMRAEKVGDETVLSQIVDMVAQAQRSRAPIQRLVDVVAAWFVPAVILAAAATFAVWAIAQPAQPALAYALVNAVAVLIIACPCALGLATPMSIMVGVGRGAKEGVLVKNAEVLETMERVNVLVVDKTGTLTEGNPKVTNVVAAEGWSEDDVLRLAAAVEAASEHPLAEAVVAAARERDLELPNASDFDSTTGAGVRASVEEQAVMVGKHSLLQEAGVDGVDALHDSAADLERQARTVVYVGVGGAAAGLIAIADPIKKSTPDALDQLRAQGLRIVMLTGDNEATARAVAEQLGIQDYTAGVKPEEKYNQVAQLRERGDRVAMAGDGVNDAPALAAADVGIAMGAGAGVAIESAGVTLVGGDLGGVVRAIALSRRTMSNIRQNLVLAFGYNVLAVPIAAGVLYPFFGLLLSPMIAAAAMSASSLTVVGNSLRLRTVKLR